MSVSQKHDVNKFNGIDESQGQKADEHDDVWFSSFGGATIFAQKWQVFHLNLSFWTIADEIFWRALRF
jgi:hypothetical protein